MHSLLVVKVSIRTEALGYWDQMFIGRPTQLEAAQAIAEGSDTAEKKAVLKH